MTDKLKILVIDDEPIVCKGCYRILSEEGYEATTVCQGKEGIAKLKEEDFDIVITDLKIPDISGMDVLKYAKENFSDVEVIMITGYSTIGTAVERIKQGAFDYIPKPFTPDELLKVVREAAIKRTQCLERIYQCKPAPHKFGLDNIIGNSKKMFEVYEKIEKVASTDTTVLISGESGTGKELVARAVHNHSLRRNKQFIPVDCSTLAQSLLESELFGHMKGSFTGAIGDKRGLFEIANEGTIFLDEIANIDMDVQSKLLRVLEEREYKPVGSTKPQKVDIRLIAATNRDLRIMIEKGKFREDLYYRLNVFPVNMPPLREHREDIPILAYHFLRQINQILNKRIKGFSKEAVEVLVQYNWPGNVRELKNTVERAAIMTEGKLLSTEHLSDFLGGEKLDKTITVPSTNEELKRARKEARGKAVEDIERLFALNALIENDWSVTKAAESTGMQRTNLQALMKKYDIKLKNYSKELGKAD